MKQAVLVFTFSPIQSFISEARRPSDAYAGSRILSELATAAGNEIKRLGGEMVYPSGVGQDSPNKLVAIISQKNTASIPVEAEKAFRNKWIEIAETAKSNFLKKSQHVSADPEWEKIWVRHINNFPWEIYWVSQLMEGTDSLAENYRKAYTAAETALNAMKRQRQFSQTDPEIGQKDSLSGVRQYLKTKAYTNASDYWSRVQSRLSPSELRVGERLDSIGVIKRFGQFGLGGKGGYLGFPSTSSIASCLYLNRCENSVELQEYRDSLKELNLPRVRDNPNWPFDGDYLYSNSLDGIGTPEVINKLKQLHKKHGSPPTYFAIVMMDGDDMGETIGNLLTNDEPIQAHMEFSQKLSDFAQIALDILINNSGFPVYIGGDDLLFFSPVEKVLRTSWDLVDKFHKTVSKASGGVAIVHHTFPLSAALRASRQAEYSAKQFSTKGNLKNAVCVQALKRSGETLKVTAHWDDLPKYLWEIIDWFSKGAISSRFAYEVKKSAYFLPMNKAMIEAEFRRLLIRHKVEGENVSKIVSADWAHYLSDWAAAHPGGLDAVADWILLARFLAKGGDD